MVISRKHSFELSEEKVLKEVMRRKGTFKAKEFNMLLSELPGKLDCDLITANLASIKLHRITQEDLLNLLHNLNNEHYPHLNQ